MISAKAAASAIATMGMMRFFPSDPEVKAKIVELIGKMCSNDAQVRWLADRMVELHGSQWPGPDEMRAVLCSKFRPKDGIERDSAVYPDGIPSEIPARNYELLGPAKEQRQITGESQPPTADDDLNTRICDLAAKLSMRKRLESQRPMLAVRMDADKAIYKFKCANCESQQLVGVPLDARKFNCPAGCGAAYEQWVTVTGLYQILCIGIPPAESAAVGAA